MARPQTLDILEARTPCRLHFGLLALGGGGADDGRRRYGGVGLMVQRPDMAIRVSPMPVGHGIQATGPMSDRAVDFAQRFFKAAATSHPSDVLIRVLRMPRAHTGLGTGTQLGMAIGRALASLIDRDDMDAHTVAGMVGRGERSAIGAHGCYHGGLIVEGGKYDLSTLSPMIARQAFPEDWRIVLVCPSKLEGLSGRREREAFATLPQISDAATDAMCRLVLLSLLPAVIERDYGTFCDALYELQQRVGECFAAAQGGVYADPLLASIVEAVRASGVLGVGQSSWGPTMYAVCSDEDRAGALAAKLMRTFDLGEGEVIVTRADNHGMSVRKTVSIPGL
ncbi:MAG: beta-RFAP synthase [Phycisphaera sp.]|nr:beta-RFAP synthase [Phycisphaera sp.]